MVDQAGGREEREEREGGEGGRRGRGKEEGGGRGRRGEGGASNMIICKSAVHVFADDVPTKY